MSNICLEDDCIAPAAIVDEVRMAGVDFDGTDALFAFDVWKCLDGHHYSVINEDDSVKVGGRPVGLGFSGETMLLLDEEGTE